MIFRVPDDLFYCYRFISYLLHADILSEEDYFFTVIFYVGETIVAASQSERPLMYNVGL